MTQRISRRAVPKYSETNIFSIFDILLHLDEVSLMNLDFHFEEAANTYSIDSINGLKNWWYTAHYRSEWREENMFRMDHYPYKDKMWINTMNHIHIPADIMVLNSPEYLEFFWICI